MTSFLIISIDRSQRIEYCAAFCKEKGIDPFDITIIDKIAFPSDKKTTSSIGIGDIKTLKEQLYLKPLKGSGKAIIIHDAHTLTPEAQNALLKVLEEPPPQTYIILATENKDAILPTILSRCAIIDLHTQRQLTEKERAEYLQLLEVLRAGSIGEKLKIAESVAKKKEDALVWFEHMIIFIREQLLSSLTDKKNVAFYTQTLLSLQKTYTLLKNTNVNMRFAIETTFLSISS